MEHSLNPFSDEEQAAKLESILTEKYPEWEEWFKSPVYGPFSTRNQKLIIGFLAQRNMVRVAALLNAKLFILEIMYTHIIHTLSREETLQDYQSWLKLYAKEPCKPL